MTVQASDPFLLTTGNGTTVSFGFDFPAASASYVFGSVDRVVDESATVVLNPDQSNDPGGTITFSVAPPNNSAVFIFRQTSADQLTEYPTSGRFPAKAHERALDKLTMLVQDYGLALSARALRVPEEEEFVDAIPQALERAGNFLGFDDNGNPIATQPVQGPPGPQGPQGEQGEPGEVQEAPQDGEPYVRENAVWVPAASRLQPLKVGLNSLGLSDSDFANDGTPEDIFEKMRQIPDALDDYQSFVMRATTGSGWDNIRSCLPVDRQGIIECVKTVDNYWKITFAVSNSNSGDRSRSYALDGANAYDTQQNILWAEIATDSRNPTWKTAVSCAVAPTSPEHLTRRDWVEDQYGAGGDTDWVNLTLINGWVAGSSAPQYRTKNGQTFLRGQISGTSATSATYANLPAASRPTASSRYIAYLAATDGTSRATVTSPGNMQIPDYASITNDIDISTSFLVD